MNITIENPAEAFAAITALVISADKIGTLEEKKFLFNNVKELDIFQDYSDSQFIRLIAETNKQVCQIFSTQDDTISREGITFLCNAIKNVLDPEHFEDAYGIACQLACTDGLVESEQVVLDHIQVELGLNRQVAEDILAKAQQM